MTVAYRADTGTLLADSVSGAQSISFPGTLPQVDDIVVAGGDLFGSGTRTSTITDNRNSPYVFDVRKYTVAGLNSSEATIASVKVAVSASPYTVSFDTTVTLSYYAVGAIAFSGVNTTTPLDVVASASEENINKSSQVTGTTGAIALTDSVAVIALAVDCSGSVLTLTDSGFTIPIKEVDGTVHAVGGLGYKVGLSAGAQAETWTYGQAGGASTDDHAAGIAVYKGTNPVIYSKLYSNGQFFVTNLVEAGASPKLYANGTYSAPILVESLNIDSVTGLSIRHYANGTSEHLSLRET